MWGVAQLRPYTAAAADAIRNLARQHYEVFHPVCAVRKVKRNTVLTVEEPVFKGYIFVELNGKRWTPINSTLGISKLLTRQSPTSEWLEPCPVDAFVEGLRACAPQHATNGCNLLPIGTTVRVTSGPFAKHEGTIASWQGADRVNLLLWLLSRHVQVTVSVASVIAV